MEAKAINTQIEEILVIGAKVSKKSNLLATNLALYLSIDPSRLYFFLKIHVHPIGFAPWGRSTKVHVSFFLIESIFILITCS